MNIFLFRYIFMDISTYPNKFNIFLLKTSYLIVKISNVFATWNFLFSYVEFLLKKLLFPIKI